MFLDVVDSILTLARNTLNCWKLSS